MTKKIAYITGSRADWGIVRRYLKLLNDDKTIDLSIIATGALLSKVYGHQVDLIRKDGFKIDTEIEIPLNSKKVSDTIKTMSVALDRAGEWFEKNKYDLVIILGDRFEIMSFAIAAAMQKLPILHLHGGEATYANYDEFIRHAITKMSLYHFASCEEYKKRIIQLGENPNNVFNLGALGAENCMFIEENNVPSNIKGLENYFTVLFHPETLTNVNPLEQVNNLLSAIDEFKKYNFIFLGTNADTYSDVIRDRIKDYVKNNSNTKYIENLPTAGYHYLLKNSICLIGNSSSGIIEAPSLGVYTVNIGDRQKGRIKGNSIIDTKCNRENIVQAITTVLKNANNIKPVNPYYKANTSDGYYKKTVELLERLSEDIKEPKIFYDLLFKV